MNKTLTRLLLLIPAAGILAVLAAGCKNDNAEPATTPPPVAPGQNGPSKNSASGGGAGAVRAQ